MWKPVKIVLEWFQKNKINYLSHTINPIFTPRVAASEDIGSIQESEQMERFCVAR